MAEISETDDSVTLEATYNGERFDPVSDGNELSVSIINKCSDDLSFGYENGVNTFRSILRNNKEISKLICLNKRINAPKNSGRLFYLN